MKSKKFLFVVAAAAILITGAFLLTKLGKYFRLLDEDSGNDLETVYTLSGEDSTFIKPEYWRDLIVDQKAQSKLSFPVLMATLQNSWQMVEFKFPVTTSSLSRLLNDSLVNKQRTHRVPYRIFSQDAYKISFHPTGFQPVGAIAMTLFGDSTRKKIINDSATSYISKCRSFSLTFNKRMTVDVYVEATGRQPVPINVVLLKRSGFLYVFLLIRKDANLNMPSHKLVDILNI